MIRCSKARSRQIRDRSRGDFSQGGMTFPFALSWKGEPKIEATPKIR